MKILTHFHYAVKCFIRICGYFFDFFSDFAEFQPQEGESRQTVSAFVQETNMVGDYRFPHPRGFFDSGAILGVLGKASWRRCTPNERVLPVFLGVFVPQEVILVFCRS